MDAGVRVAAYLRATLACLPTDAGEPGREGVACLFVGHGAAFRHAMHELGVLSLHEVRRFSLYHARPIVFEARTGDVWAHVAGDWKLRESSPAAGPD